MVENTERGKTSLAVKVGFWYVLSSFVAKSLAFLTTPIFSRLMSESDYGEFSNFASWVTTLFIVTSLEMFNTLPRAYYDYKDEYDAYNSTIAITSCMAALLCYLIFLVFGDWLLDIVAIPPEYVHMLFFLLMLQAGKQIYLTRERTLYRYKSVIVITLLSVVIPTLIAVVLVSTLPQRYHLAGRIYGTYVPMALLDLGCMLVLLVKGRSFRPKYVRYALVLSLPLLVHYLAAYLLTSTNVIVTKSVLGAEAAAVMGIVTSVIHILTVLTEALTGAVTTWLMDNLEQEKYQKIRRDTLVYVGGLALLTVGVILFAPEVVYILGGTKYKSATVLIPVLVLSVFIQSVSSLFTVILTYEKKIAKTVVFTAVAAAVSILSKVYLLPQYGIEVLPVINAAVFAGLFIVNYILVAGTRHRSAVNVKGVAGIIVAVGALAAIANWLYAHTLLRYGIILVMIVIAAVVGIYYRKALLTMLKARKARKKSGQRRP